MNGGSNGGTVNNNHHSEGVHNSNSSTGGGHVTFPSFRVRSPDTAQLQQAGHKPVIKHDADKIQSAGEGEAVRVSEEEQSVQHHNNNNTKLQAAPPPPRPSELYICGQEAGAGAGRGETKKYLYKQTGFSTTSSHSSLISSAACDPDNTIS